MNLDIEITYTGIYIIVLKQTIYKCTCTSSEPTVVNIDNLGTSRKLTPY